jgi:hypothetical protein
VGGLGKERVLAELLGVGDPEPRPVLVAVHVVRLYGVEALRLARAHPGARDRGEDFQLADVEPLLPGPAVVVPAEDALGEPPLVGPPVLPAADAYVADGLAAVRVNPVDGRPAGVEAVEILGVHVEQGFGTARELPLPTRGGGGSPPRLRFRRGGRGGGLGESTPAASTTPRSIAFVRAFILRASRCLPCFGQRAQPVSRVSGLEAGEIRESMRPEDWRPTIHDKVSQTAPSPIHTVTAVA